MKRVYSIQELSILLNIDFEGDPKSIINNINTLEKAVNNEIAILIEKKYFNNLESTNASCLLVSNEIKRSNKSLNYLISDNPKLSMAKLINLFSNRNKFDSEISNNSKIESNVSLGSQVLIKDFSFLGKNSSIGNNAIIYPHVYIGENSSIGNNTIIYPNVTIMDDCQIGDNVIINAGSVIGSDGYGFVQVENNKHFKVEQIGNVIIEDNVEIGANVTIDRATIGSTIISEGTKVDNLVHIAHNVNVGKRSLLVAQSGIAGSSKIGANCILAAQSGVSGHVSIGKNSIVLARGGVTKSIPENSKVSGFPAKNHRDEQQNLINIKKIPKLISDLNFLKN